MRRERIPRSPFATRLSGSAREIELRIRNILSGPKKRPPNWLILLTALVILACGSLVSCQSMEPPESSSDSSLQKGGASSLELLYQAMEADAILDTSLPVHKELLSAFPSDGYILTAACFYDDYPRYSLTLGVCPVEGGALTGPVFHATGSVGYPQLAVFQKDGKSYLLYTANYSRQGYSGGEAGVVTLDGGRMTWVWPVEGDIRDQHSQAYADYRAYWEHRKPLLAPGGVDLFTENLDYGPYEGAPPQWIPDSGEWFFPAPEQDLPIGVLYQTRVWLEEFTRRPDDRSACCRILSLTPDETRYPGQTESETAYRLKACPDGDEAGYFTATLIYNEDNQVDRMVAFACSDGYFVQTMPPSDPLYELNFAAAKELIADYLQQEYSPNRVYFPSDQSDTPQVEDWRIDGVTLRGEQLSAGVVKTAYQVDFSRCRTAGEEEDWFRMPSVVLILRREEDGVFQEVLGHKNPAPYPPTADQATQYYFGG